MEVVDQVVVVVEEEGVGLQQEGLEVLGEQQVRKGHNPSLKALEEEEKELENLALEDMLVDLGEGDKRGLEKLQQAEVEEEPKEEKNWVFHQLGNQQEELEVGGLD